MIQLSLVEPLLVPDITALTSEVLGEPRGVYDTRQFLSLFLFQNFLGQCYTLYILLILKIF